MIASLIPILAPVVVIIWLAEVALSPPPEDKQYLCISIEMEEEQAWELPPLPPFDEEAFERQYWIERIGGLEAPW